MPDPQSVGLGAGAGFLVYVIAQLIFNNVYIRKDLCNVKHAALTRELEEIKCELKEIKHLLTKTASPLL